MDRWWRGRRLCKSPIQLQVEQLQQQNRKLKQEVARLRYELTLKSLAR